jgi:DNA uptake protein ComE-like DNA-binding protein
MSYLRKSSLLLISAWGLAILAVFAVGLNRLVITRLDACRRIEARIVGRQLAYAAFLYAKEEILAQPDAYMTLSGLAQPRKRALGDAAFSFTVSDEAAKININSASADVIARLLALDQDNLLVQNIVATRPYPAIEALLGLKGMTPEKLNAIQDMARVADTQDKAVNINTAAKEVLLALGLTPKLVEALIDYRNGGVVDETGVKDRTFGSIHEVISTLQDNKYRLDIKNDIKSLTDVEGLFRFSSDCFSLKITTLISGRPGTTYDIIISKGRIVSWEEL